ncbi:MAG: PQQ-like beta-propeller repeat protein [Planctomycetota bacterium]|nr:PQQ-like beta-propeller repeat protein [Planctomycetota bacterium]
MKIDWKGTWEETLAANLDPGKTWLKTLEADESLRQAAALIVRLREIELLEAMIAHFPQAGVKRQEAYHTIAKDCAAAGDRLRAVQWLRRLIADYPDSKPLAGEALAAILEYSCPFDALPEGQAWAQYASGGLEALVKGGQLPPSLPSVVQARGRMCAAWRADQRPLAARRFLDSLRAAEGEKTWWLEARADLLLGAGHMPQAALLYRQAGNAARAASLRDQSWLGRPDVEVAPPPPGLAQRIERLAGAIRLTGAKAVQNVENVQDVLNRCVDSGAIQTVDDSLQCSSAILLDSALRELKADLGPLRRWQQQKADARVDALLGEGAAEEATRLVRRYPWARRVQEVLIERGERALREGRADEAAGAFDNAAAHAEDPTLLAQARLGLWLALGQGTGGPEAMERAMALVPDADPAPRQGAAGTAAQAKAFVRNRLGAGEEALPSLPRAPSRRIQLPAAMAAPAPALHGRCESWCLGPWAIRRIESLPEQVVVFGPRHVACYDGASLALRWHHAAPGALEEPGPDDEGDARLPPAWRPSAMASPRSPSVAGNVVYALLARGQGGADLRALDVRTGQLIWTTQARPEWNALRILGEPAAMEDLVYVLAMEQDLEGTCTPYLVCLAGDDAKIVWKRRLGTMMLRERPIAMARYACGVALHQGSVYLSTNMGILAKCDARTGSPEWLRTYHAATPGEAPDGRARREGSVPLVAGDLVYFAPRDHSGVIALDRRTGQLAWESPLVPSDQIVGLAGRTLIVRDANELAALDATTGEELWNRPVDSDGAAPAVISGGQVLVAAGDKLLRFSAQTGHCARPSSNAGPCPAAIRYWSSRRPRRRPQTSWAYSPGRGSSACGSDRPAAWLGRWPFASGPTRRAFMAASSSSPRAIT